MRLRVIALILFSLALRAGGQVYHSCPVHDPTAPGYENPLNNRWLSAYDVKFYDLRLSVSNSNTEITGTAIILVESVGEMDTMVLELNDALDVSRVAVSGDASGESYGELADFDHAGDTLFIPLDRKRTPGEQFFVLIEYGGEAGQSRGFFAGITNRQDPAYGFDVTYTLSEPHNAKDWFPAKQVLGDKIDSAWISLRCDDQLMAASNGILVDIEPGQGDTHIFRWQTRYPTAYYLLSFAVADYRDLSFHAALSTAGDSVLVQNYIYDSDVVQADWEDQIRATAPMITAFSTLLQDYPFSGEKYGHAMAPMGGGMEHQTMTTLQDFSFYLVAHELAHQWFGDYITCGNWQDIWINEGFASYLEYVAAQQILGQQAADGWMSNAMSIALGESEGSVFVPEADVEDTYRLFDYGLSYKKGAILLHMIRYHLDDDDLFFRILQSYLSLYGNGHATGEDFRKTLEAESGLDFSCFFEQWYYGEGYPHFNLHWYQVSDSLTLRFEQQSTAPQVTPLFKTPFDVEIRYLDGKVSNLRLMQDEAEEVFSIPVDGMVSEILFDPDQWLLNSASVIHQVPPGRKFVYGPNPVNDALYIYFENASLIEKISITTLNGQPVLTRTSSENPVILNLGNLADGAYMLVMQYQNQHYIERIVKISGE